MPLMVPDEGHEGMLHRGHSIEVALDGERIGADEAGRTHAVGCGSGETAGGHVGDVGARHGGVGACFTVADEAGISFDFDEAAIELEVELQGLDGGDLDFALVLGGERAVRGEPAGRR